MITLVQDYFSQSAERYPEKPAVVCGDDSISYRDMEYESNVLSAALKERNVSRGNFVPFFMPKSIGSIRSILAILKADCAYVPLDFNAPGSRLLSILKACKATCVLVSDESSLRWRKLIGLPENEGLKEYRIINIDEALQSFEGEHFGVVYRNLSIDLAYVLFTSGSTGVPKGVMISHHAIIDYIEWCVDAYRLSSEDKIANHAPLYFDNSTFDLYTAFKTGATLYLVHDAINAVLPKMVGWLEKNRISVFFCVPSVLALIHKSGRLKKNSLPELRHVICAGEALPPSVVREWMKLLPHAQFANMYGPTEITVDCSYYVIPGLPDENSTSISIGHARKNMELFVRIESGEITQKPGARGELLVRGVSVSYGYLGDSEKTRKSFIQNPIHSIFHDPLYCTGDLVCLGDDGMFDFLGRVDSQIKFLGQRIELGEIESAMMHIDGVVEAAVVFCPGDEISSAEIGALVYAGGKVTDGFLRKQLSGLLPGYMVPTKLVVSSGPLPKTSNDKVDRKVAYREVFE
ncbi:amino acid adenylation domain-containing protein [Porticoccus sp. GXU_MW_L64]